MLIHAAAMGGLAVFSAMQAGNRPDRLTDIAAVSILELDATVDASQTPESLAPPEPQAPPEPLPQPQEQVAAKPEPELEPAPEPEPVVVAPGHEEPKPHPQVTEVPQAGPPPASVETEPAPTPEPAKPAEPVPAQVEIDPEMGTLPPPARPQPTITRPAPMITPNPPSNAATSSPVSARRPTASFAGVEASPARRIVYLIDASGAMTSSLRFVKEELARSVARLDPSQRFQVIVFRRPLAGGSDATGSVEYFAVPGGNPGVVNAERETKIALAPWLFKIQPYGASDPIIGLRAALSQEPDIIFVLTRSIRRSGGVDVEAANGRVLSDLDALNPRGWDGKRSAVIKTIQFLEDDPTGLMQAIAREHGDGEGSYRMIPRSKISGSRTASEKE
jgi:hypothetical protein